MNSHKKFIVSHAPFWHNGSGVPERNFNTILAALPAVLMGLSYFGISALGVLCLSVATAAGWELIFNKLSKRPNTIGDGHALLIGLLFGMLLPATVPWWLVTTGTFLAIFIGKQIYGGIGSNPFNPAVLAIAITTIAWHAYFDLDAQFINFNFSFKAADPLVALKAFGPEATMGYNLTGLLLGQQVGGIGATCGLALAVGGVYLIARGIVRWEIPVAFIAGIFITASLFHTIHPDHYVGPLFHLLTGYTLIGAFFLATDDSSSPVNTLPMLIYGAMGGVMTILIRNIGAYADGVFYAILVINLINPLIDKIRPKAIGKAA
jgi:H+/Na+-translocating ferredoxin:NAD+ oxidoreductase subunit D